VTRPIMASVAAAVLVGALPARAHVRLVSPVSRYGDEMKSRPCGRPGGTRTANVTAFRPGQTITVVFDEIIPHPGYFRIAFDPAGDDDLGPPVADDPNAIPPTFTNPPDVLVLVDHIPKVPPPPALMHGEVPVTLPEVECDACTLQLIQIMTDKPPFDGLDDFYYQCADLVLSRTAPLGGPPVLASPKMGGCASAPGGSASGLLAFALGLLVTRRRPARAARLRA
jgi:uncharacterized protein (TIGR03382 family)